MSAMVRPARMRRLAVNRRKNGDSLRLASSMLCTQADLVAKESIMTERTFAMIDGNDAAAHVAYRLSEVIAIYPITPSSPPWKSCLSRP